MVLPGEGGGLVGSIDPNWLRQSGVHGPQCCQFSIKLQRCLTSLGDKEGGGVGCCQLTTVYLSRVLSALYADVLRTFCGKVLSTDNSIAWCIRSISGTSRKAGRYRCL